MTNFEGRAVLRRRALPPPDGVRTDLQILCGLAAALGRGRFFEHDDAGSVFEELRRASAGGVADYSGITYERITAEHGVFWPCPVEDHPGTLRPFLDSFPTEDGRARYLLTGATLSGRIQRPWGLSRNQVSVWARIAHSNRQKIWVRLPWSDVSASAPEG